MLYSIFFQPRAGSGVDKIDLLHFLAGCCKRQINHALSGFSLNVVFFECVLLVISVLFCCVCMCSVLWLFWLSCQLSWIYTGQSASPTTRSDQEPNNHYCLTQSAPDAFASLVTSAELTPVRIILGHCTPVLLVYPSTGGEDPAGRDRPGYELSRMIYDHSIWVWRQLNGVLRTEQLGRHSWKRLRRW